MISGIILLHYHVGLVCQVPILSGSLTPELEYPPNQSSQAAQMDDGILEKNTLIGQITHEIEV